MEIENSTSASPRKWHRRKQARPDEISKAALIAFAQKGYAAATMADIAKLAGITKGTIYLYFKNKEDLFNALVREHIVDRLAAHFSGMENSEDVISAINHCFDVVSDMALTEEVLVLGRVITAEARNFPAIAQFWGAEVIDSLLDLVTALLRRGGAQGTLGAVNPEAAARLCLALVLQELIWHPSFNVGDREHSDPRSMMELQRAIIIQGIRAAQVFV
ncbi:AcrR family transcriptional regulator [Rhizomicrobium palustre]|uniref:AcrR family transcriptional regulator n=1 Tax=Rhizomicrobium palustre TaxID=189966 RepID=A0A846MUV7_9PROT|nr:TetR/AcrR family transcriptional regulator [Rhizomicrobium palustre]NIK87143.1 AcrR family transcriptional regulator [Rhizomicrobium palustre]